MQFYITISYNIIYYTYTKYGILYAMKENTYLSKIYPICFIERKKT